MTATKRWDVILIGSGISSLMAAAILAKKGKSVCVLEQYNKAGGYMHCFSRFGVRFDTGAHYVGAMEPGQPFQALLSYVDAYDPELFVALEPDGFDVFHFPEFEISIPKGYDRVIARLTERFPDEASGIAGFFAQVQAVTRNFPTYQFGAEIDVVALVRQLETPLATVIKENVRTPALQSILGAYCALHGVKPADVSFGMHAIVMDSLIRGPFGLAKGGDGLTKSLVNSIRNKGGEVLLKKRVARIENTGRIANAVITTDGERYEADWVISGIDPKQTFPLLDDSSALTPAFRTRLADMQVSDGLFGVYAACSADSGISPRQNHYYFEDSRDLNLIFEHRRPDEVPAAVFMSPVDRTATEAGRSGRAVGMNLHALGLMEWFAPWSDSRYAKRPEEYEEVKRTYAERIFERVEMYQPGFRASVTGFETSSPMTNLHFNGATKGSAYGIYHSIQNTGARALGPRTHVANLLLTGQSCLFPGLLGAAISGLRTSGHIVGIKPILSELKELSEREAAK